MDEWFDSEKRAGKHIGFSFICMEDMDPDTFNKLVEMGDHETIVWNIERYIHDKVAEKMSYV